MNEKNTYSYSTQENKEIQKIRDKYIGQSERDTKLERLRSLDASVHSKATALSVAVGIIGALILGAGMSCIMVWSDKMFVTGIILGVIGIIITVIAYPVYKIKSEKMRQKIAPEILKITDELMK